MSSLLKGVTGTLGLQVVSTLLGFSIQILLARLLSLQAFGQYTYLLSIVSVLTVIATFGIATSVLRFHPETRGTASEVSFVHYSLFVPLIGSLLAGLGGGYIIQKYVQMPGIFVPLLVFSLVFAGSIKRICRSSLMSRGSVYLSFSLGQNLTPAIFVTFLSVVLLTTDRGLSLGEALVTYTSFSFFAAVVMIIILFRKIEGELFRFHYRLSDWYRWLMTSAPLMLTNSTQILLKEADILLLGYLAGVEYAGIYAVATKLNLLISFSTTSLGHVLSPKIGSLYYEGRIEELQRKIFRGCNLVSAFSLLTCLGLIVIAPSALWLYGEHFYGAWLPLVLLIPGTIFSAMTSQVRVTLALTGHERRAFSISMISLLANVTLNLVLIPRYGMAGCAVATTLTIFARDIAMYLFSRNLTGLRVRPDFETLKSDLKVIRKNGMRSLLR